jgi:hypothetical protein
MKSFRPKDGGGSGPDVGGDRDFKGERRRKQVQPQSVGGHRDYHTSRIVEALLVQRIAAHVTINAAHYTTGPDRCTLDSPDYRGSQIVRKRIEQFLGWGKTVDGLRKSRPRGVRRNMQLMCLTGLTCNLVRISRMCPTTG